MKRFIPIFLSLFFSYSVLLAQNGSKAKPCAESCTAGCSNGWCWGKDPETSKVKNALYTDALKLKNYEETVAPLQWLFANTPNLNKAIYQNGEKIYKALLKKEKDPQKKMALQDTILSIYKRRIDYFGQRKKVLSRKGNVAYVYLIKRSKDPAHYRKVYDMYDEIISVNGEKANRTAITYYIKLSAVLYKFNVRRETLREKKEKLEAKPKLAAELAALEKVELFTEEQLLDNYDKVEIILDNIIAKEEGKSQEKWQKCKDGVEGILTNTVDFDCTYVTEKLASRLDNPKDLRTAKKAVKYIIGCKSHEGTNCSDNPLFLKAIKNIYTAEPSVGLGVTIAKKHLQAEENDVAKDWYNKVIEMAKEKEEGKLGELYMDVASIYRVEKNKSKSREYALLAAKSDETKTSEAYIMIGDLYMFSFKECANVNPVKNRAVYLLAYDVYQKAGDTAKMRSAREQFPSAADIHIANMKVGDAVSISCWINRKTTIRSRPE